MRPPFVSVLVTLSLVVAGMAPAAAEVSSGTSGHACCRTMQAAAAHAGCPQPAAVMRCCGSAPDRSTETKAPPVSSASPQQSHYTLLTGHAAHVPGLLGLAASCSAHAFVSAHLKLPVDPLYLRNAVLLI